ncbi:hypothetical protein P691DRAFT_793341 [Macrolepiota fuliginosa MF-IS2]|uniref:DDE-1 domain-containing protein n=1 Tax=Macrolepiota fuliginosa MF-IS2 TaxID=1400762 RepID=A0A9P5WZ48_9AGAR|nr:hypothetical protein P691DRAFT_793341 [Macrolepiota fuliginosa MF-IS2]
MTPLGFPLSHQRLREIMNKILYKWLGPYDFPDSGVGKCWTQCFIEKHSDHLKTSWSTPLKSKCGDAVNKATNNAWWDLLGSVQTEYSIMPENIYGVDEVGCQPYGMDQEHYQHQTGNHENIMVLVTICADGISTPPAIIFKGKGYQGWTDGKLGMEWMKLFDKATTAKANGKWQLLLVDSHNSHYTIGFLKYAHTHMIHVLCYPSHTTHIYQGLDVTNFLKIYGKAHLAALTCENIKATFQKAGVWPFNPAVVTKETLAPSKPTSQQSNLPIAPPTPLRIITNLLQKLSLEDDLEAISEVDKGNSIMEPSSPSAAIAE